MKRNIIKTESEGGEAMPIFFVRNDITKMEVDAIVNPTDRALSGSGGVDLSVHKAAGAAFSAECKTLGGCEVGEAKITKAYALPAKYVIHTVGPKYFGGIFKEKEKLVSCYKNSLELAKSAGCETLAVPIISAGTFGYPKDKALKIAVDTVGDFLMENEMTVYIVVFDKEMHKISTKLFADIKEYIDDNYVEEQHIFNACNQPILREREREYSVRLDESEAPCCKAHFAEKREIPLEKLVEEIDESFSEMLLRKIDEAKMTDAECYKKAYIDRKLFSKIRGDKHYKPKKTTALAFAIALELSLDETRELLMKAGFALSHSNKFDIIVEYFIKQGNYNILEINEALFEFDQVLIGS